MERSVSGDKRSAFEKRLLAFYPRLYPLALRLCQNQADAHDLVQDTVERGLRCRRLFRTGDAPDRWMSTILRRIFVDGYRSRRRRACRVSVQERLGWMPSVSEPEEPGAWEAFTLEDVQRALSLIDPAARETFALFAFNDLGQDEIARRLSISRQTVATRVFRTRGKLREVLASGEYRGRGAAGRSPRRAA